MELHLKVKPEPYKLCLRCKVVLEKVNDTTYKCNLCNGIIESTLCETIKKNTKTTIAS